MQTSVRQLITFIFFYYFFLLTVYLTLIVEKVTNFVLISINNTKIAKIIQSLQIEQKQIFVDSFFKRFLNSKTLVESLMLLGSRFHKRLPMKVRVP